MMEISISLKNCADRIFRKYVFRSLSECKTGRWVLIRLLIFGSIGLYVVGSKIGSLTCCLDFNRLASALDNLEVSLKCFSTTFGLCSVAIK